MKLKKAAALAMAAIMTMSMAGVVHAENITSNTNTETAEQVDKIVVALGESSFDMSPFGANSIPRMWMCQNVYGSLFCTPYYGATLEELQPWLAKGYEKVDDLTYKVELYDYIKDSKGNDITSEDIVYSYEKMYTMGAETRINTYLDNIEIVDDYNMIFHLKKYGPGVLEFLFGNYTLNICDKDWFENATDEEKYNDPACTGAYQIVDYVAGSSITLEAIDDYWQQDESLLPDAALQNVKTIEYKVITENSMRSIALENGEIDATVINASELPRFYDGENAIDGYTVDIEGGTFCNVVFLNMDSGKSPLADDENLRLAALYALDSESILYGGDYDETTAEVCASLGTSTMAGYDENWSEDYFNYDPDKAREYYEASGHADGEVTIRILSRTSVADGIHAVMVANLEAVGFKVELLSYDQALFNTYKTDSTQWDMILDNKGATGNIVTCWDNNFNPDSFENGSVCFTHDDTLTELLNAATTTGTEEDINAFHEYLKELACAKGLFTSKNLMVGQNGILNLETNSNMMPRVNAFTFAADYQSNGQ
ncbi:MAG: ABC transporter substrate-binding protein [Eubacteriales bacterium]|nr:ABC transporter substrate-binding protein [Eubacteriales bacterium]